MAKQNEMVERANVLYREAFDIDGLTGPEYPFKDVWRTMYSRARQERRREERAAERGQWGDDAYDIYMREHAAMNDINGGGDDEMSQFST